MKAVLALLTILGILGVIGLVMVFLAAAFGGNPSGVAISLCAGAAFSAAVAWIVYVDRHAGKTRRTVAHAGCLVMLVGLALISGLILALGLWHIEIPDRAAEAAVREARERETQDLRGISAFITNFDVRAGSMEVQVTWASASERARKALSIGSTITFVPFYEPVFAGTVRSTEDVDALHQKVQVAIDARAAARLPGMSPSVNIFLPGTGPALPEDHPELPPKNR